MARKTFILIPIIAIMLVTLACSISVPRSISRNINLETIVGSGKVTEETREVSGFTEVVLSSTGDLDIEQGSEEGLTIEAEDNLLPYIETNVRGGTLEIGFKNETSVSPKRPVKFHLKVKTLEGIRISGSGSAAAEQLQADRLDIRISGMGNVKIDDLQSPEVNIEIPGSGTVELAGQGENQDIHISGMGTILTAAFDTQTTNVTINGSGDVKLTATENLDIKINGNGTVEYSGDPKVTQHVNGSSTIRQVN